MTFKMSNIVPVIMCGLLISLLGCPPPPATPVYDIYVGVQADDDYSYLKHLLFDPASNAVGDWDAPFQLNGDHQLRGMDTDGAGKIVAANFFGGIETIDINGEPTSEGAFFVDHTDGAAYQINNYHSLCKLPNGRLLVGDYPFEVELGKVSRFNEYDADGHFIRNVYETPDLDDGYSAVSCLAASDNEIFVSEGSRGTPLGGRLLRFTRPTADDDWALVNEFKISDFDEDQEPPTAASGVWMMTVDEAYVYVARYTSSAAGTEFPKLIRCPLDFLQEDCVGYGDDVPSGAAIKSMVPVPGTGGDLLVFTHNLTHKLYLFDSDGLWTELYDLNNLNLGSGVSYSQIWANAILK